MRIAFEASSFIEKKPTGVAVYTRNFIDAFARLESGDSLSILYEISRLKYRKYWYKPPSISTRIYHKSLLPVFKNTDIVHGLDCRVPNWKRSKKIVNVYDIFTSINHDDQLAPRAFREHKESVLNEAVRISDLIVTCSENTRQDVIDFYQIPESIVVNVYPGIDMEFDAGAGDQTKTRKKFGLERDYLLFLGSISGRKNTANLVEGFSRSKASKEFDLVLAGLDSYRSDLTHDAIDRNNIGERVKLIGYVPDEYRAALYSGSSGFVFPTFYEGFGFPILEAMQCGVPVLTSNVGSAPEVGGDHAIYVDPRDVDSIAEGIDQLVGTSDHDLESAKKHANAFTWKKTATKMLQIYADIFEGNR